jgi:penicillin G amidase
VPIINANLGVCFRIKLVLLLTLVSGLTAPRVDYGKVELIYDTWGIPHVFSSTDAGGLYGLGYATAEERGFQMTYNLRIIQGRLSEILGERQRGSRKETTVDHDRLMRTIGWTYAANRTAANLDSGTRAFLVAYCEGVNDSFAAQRTAGKLHPLFEKLGVTAETWTPADCLLSWWHLAQFFATDGTRDLLVWRNRENPRPGQPQPPKVSRSWLDDSTAVVQPTDVIDTWLKRVEKFRISLGAQQGGSVGEGPKFSHAWVVGGKKTTSGSAVLVSDPQTPVRNPSLWMEFHVCGKTFNARGIGVPGSPGLLLGFNQGIAWGLTALGADQADLFRLETSGEHSEQYRWNGQWRPFQTRTERIKVKDGADIELTVRETHLGPVASAFCFRQPNDPEVALKRIPICEPERDTIQAVFEMMRAKSASQFASALKGWRFPSANCVYGDSKGHIGYSVVGAIPIRPKSAPDPNGNEALPARTKDDDWRGYLPHELVPQVLDPKAGLLFSGNHRPVGSFYQIPLGISTGSMGDTIRSWRLRERLGEKQQFTPRDVLEVHFDTVNPARREIVRLGIHLRDTKQEGLSSDSLAALEVLEKWFKAGASSDLNAEGAELATRISTFFRFIATPLALKYGGGESGLARFLKDASGRIIKDSKASLEEDECRFIDKVLTDAWNDLKGRGQTRSRTTAQQNKLGWFDSLDGFGSLDTSHDLAQPGITCLDGQTIKSQASQSYTQWVPLDKVDSAMTICPIGHSDRLDSPWRTSTMELWGESKLHPAPLTRSAVEKIRSRSSILSK